MTQWYNGIIENCQRNNMIRELLQVRDGQCIYVSMRSAHITWICLNYVNVAPLIMNTVIVFVYTAHISQSHILLQWYCHLLYLANKWYIIIYGGTSVYGHLVSMVTSTIQSPLLSQHKITHGVTNRIIVHVILSPLHYGHFCSVLGDCNNEVLM